jgi:hypothetical protein
MRDTTGAHACARAREVTPPSASPDPQLAVWFTPENIRTSKEGSPYHDKARTACDEALEEAAIEVLSDSDWLWTVYGEICCEIIDRAHATVAERAAGR